MPLTVKHRTPDGAERLYLTDDFEVHPNGPGRTVRFRSSDGRPIDLHSGDVYVMNEQGATVASYYRLAEANGQDKRVARRAS